MQATKELLQKELEHLLEQLDSGEEYAHDWWDGVFSEEISELCEQYNGWDEDNEEEEPQHTENYLAKEAIKHPELHGLMQQVVNKIAEIGEIWFYGEECQAGGCFARELAMYDKKYIPVYYNYIQTNDLDHEVYQLYDMLAIFDRWEYSPETLPLVLYRAEHGQYAEIYDELVKDIVKSSDEAEAYYNAALEYFDDQWSFTENDRGDIDQIVDFFTPLFATVCGLDEFAMASMAVAFVNTMASGDTPTFAELLQAAKG